MWDRLSEDERAWKRRCRRFADDVIAPRAAEYDRANAFPEAIHAAAHEAGLMNLNLPVALGGQGLPHRVMAVAGEELATACAPAAFTMGFNHGALRPIVSFGTAAQQQRFVKELIEARQYASICMTEAAGSGSNLAAIRSRAVKRGDRWVISGTKAMIGNGTVASLYLVLANAIIDDHNRGLTFFAVPRGDRVRVGPNPDKLGFRCLATPTVDFDAVEVDDACRIGEVGGADAILVDSLDYMRFGGGCILLGLVVGALRDALPWLEQREVHGGQRLIELSHVQLQLGEIYAELRCLRALLWDAAEAIDLGRKASIETSILKLRASRLAERATSQIAQLFGWRGIDNDYAIQKRMRDARVTTIYEGTSEIQLLTIFGELRRAHRADGDL
jgi:alkylation response protein AidB-like acyl-CoA dehydrogenase